MLEFSITQLLTDNGAPAAIADAGLVFLTLLVGWLAPKVAKYVRKSDSNQ